MNDPFVIDMPWIFRYPFVNGLILPTRPKKSSDAYQKIWDKNGSPLVFHTSNLAKKLNQRLPFPVEFGMRYGTPSIQTAIEKLVHQAVNYIIFLPLYPQYSFSASESAIHEFERGLKKYSDRISGTSVEYFYRHPAFIQAVAAKIQASVEEHHPEKILLTYHGIPEKQLSKTKNQTNYRDQCLETSKLIQEALNFAPETITTSFQSRLGPVQWIKPYTDHVLKELPKQGVKRMIAVSPSFTADCLETLEEIQMRYHDDFLANGGEAFHYVPCVNSSDLFVDAIQQIIEPYHFMK